MINEISVVIANEAKEDSDCRAKYGAKWTRKPSGEINAQYKTIIQEA